MATRKITVVLLLSASLVLMAFPTTLAARTDDTFNCYTTDQGVNVCATIHSENGVQKFGTLNITSKDGTAKVIWTRGKGFEIVEMKTFTPKHKAKKSGKGSLQGSTGDIEDFFDEEEVPDFIDPSFTDPTYSPLDDPSQQDPACANCMNMVTRLCVAKWDSDYQVAAVTAAGAAVICLSLWEVPPAMIACEAAAVATGLALQSQADAALNLCLQSGWRGCTSSTGKACYQ